MDEILDEFTNVDTWDSLHPCDQERFFLALDKIVPGFSPEKVGDYIETAYTRQYGPDADTKTLEQNKEYYTNASEIVWKYLTATNQIN